MAMLYMNDVDPIQRLERKAFLQFMALDYCILKQTKELITIVYSGYDPPQPSKDHPSEKLKENPYKFDSDMVQDLMDFMSNPDNSDVVDELLKYFQDYNISISLQQIFSHILINAKRVHELQSIEIEDISGTSESYGTTDQVDEDILDYYREIRNSRVKEELEKANTGTPIRGEFEDIVIEIVKAIGDFSNSDNENILQKNKISVIEEIEHERDLVKKLFHTLEEEIKRLEEEKVKGLKEEKIKRLEEGIKRSKEEIKGLEEEGKSSEEIKRLKEEEIKGLEEGIKGLEEEIKRLEEGGMQGLEEEVKRVKEEEVKRLEEKVKGLKEEGIKRSKEEIKGLKEEGIKSLEEEVKRVKEEEGKSPQGIIYDDYTNVIHLAGLLNVYEILRVFLPNSIEGIVNSSILSTVSDYWGKLFVEPQPEMVNTLLTTLPKISQRFETSTTTSKSQEDIHYGCLKLIREFLQKTIKDVRISELHDLSQNPSAANCLVVFRNLRALKPVKLNEEWIKEWNHRDNLSNRLGFIYTSWWVLTSERELNILFQFALDITEDTTIFGIPDRNIIIPAAVFPGNLESTPRTTATSTIDLDYENDKRRIKIKEERLNIPGQLEKVLIQDGVKWLI